MQLLISFWQSYWAHTASGNVLFSWCLWYQDPSLSGPSYSPLRNLLQTGPLNVRVLQRLVLIPSCTFLFFTLPSHFFFFASISMAKNTIYMLPTPIFISLSYFSALDFYNQLSNTYLHPTAPHHLQFMSKTKFLCISPLDTYCYIMNLPQI